MIADFSVEYLLSYQEITISVGADYFMLFGY